MPKETTRYMPNEEIDKALADKSIRDKLKAEMEENMEKGVPKQCYVGAMLYGLDIRSRVATEDAIKHWCDGLGDFNPLYRSRDYANNSVHGGLIAPASFVGAVVALVGIAHNATYKLDYYAAAWDAGCRAEWFKVIREGDEFTAFEVPTEVIDLTREGTALQFLVRGNRVYKDQRDEVVCIFNGSFIATFPRPPVKPGELPPPAARVAPFKPYHFSIKEVEDWYNATINEEIRGATPRFWEDVNVGDELPPVHHVCTMMEWLAYWAGRGEPRNWTTQMRQRIEGAEVFGWKDELDEESGLPDFSIIHMTDFAASRWGWTNRALGAGVQLRCWLTRLVTNWMGDAGFLKKLEDQIRRPLHRESLALIKGQVVKKYIEDGEHLVDLHITLEDHWGDMPIPNGKATVVLPSRQMENWWPATSSASRTPF